MLGALVARDARYFVSPAEVALQWRVFDDALAVGAAGAEVGAGRGAGQDTREGTGGGKGVDKGGGGVGGETARREAKKRVGLVTYVVGSSIESVVHMDNKQEL